MAGAVAAIARLVPRFHGRVWLVSKCGPRTQARTRRWLAGRDFFGRTGLPPEHLRFCLRRAEKRAHSDEWWTFYKDPLDPSYVHLMSYDKGTCLTAPKTTGTGDLATLTGCAHSTAQEWFVHYRSTYYFILQNRQSGKYLAPQAFDADWSYLLAYPAAGDTIEEWEQVHTYDNVAVPSPSR